MNKKKFPEGFFTKDRPIAKPKYVNAEEMLNNYEADCEVYENSGDLLDTELWMIDYLKNHSSADVQPVIHAHWNCIDNVHSYEGTFDAYECSHCHKSFLDDLCENNGSDYVDAKKDFKYCPFCGAKMDGDEHER